MPALDNIMTGGAIHMSDQNKENPIKTLCGIALDKDNTRYFGSRENYKQATCKVCRGIFFDEKWAAEPKPEPEKETVSGNLGPFEPGDVVAQADVSKVMIGGTEQPHVAQNDPPVRTNLFGHLPKPVNVKAEDNGS